LECKKEINQHDDSDRDERINWNQVRETPEMNNDKRNIHETIYEEEPMITKRQLKRKAAETARRVI